MKLFAVLAMSTALAACAQTPPPRYVSLPAPLQVPAYRPAPAPVAAAPIYAPRPVRQSYSAPVTAAPRPYEPVASVPQPPLSRRVAQGAPFEPAAAPEYSSTPGYNPAQSAPATPAAVTAAPATFEAATQIALAEPMASAPPSGSRQWSTRAVDVSTPAPVQVAAAAPKIYAPFPRQKPAQQSQAPRASTAGDQIRFSARPSSVAGYASQATPPAIEYHIPHLPQEEQLWCWAAAAQQAIGWVNNGRAPAQCAIVALAHGLDVDECCADRDGICAKTGEIPAISTLINRFGGYSAELATVPRDPEQIYKILQEGGTLLIRLRPAPHDEAVGIRHMIVVRGIEWLRLPNNQLQATLLYNDPLGAGQRAVSFDEIVGFFEQALLVKRTG